MHGIDQRGGCVGIDQYAQETHAYASQEQSTQEPVSV